MLNSLFKINKSIIFDEELSLISLNCQQHFSVSGIFMNKFVLVKYFILDKVSFLRYFTYGDLYKVISISSDYKY